MKFPTKFEINYPLPGLRAFLIPHKKVRLQVIAGIEPDGWEHVSVSLPNREPKWGDMCYIKDLFFHDEEACLQFHPKHSEYINISPYCLHLWMPPSYVMKHLERDGLYVT